MAVPSSASVLAPAQANMPPVNHITNAIPGLGTFVSILPGDVKTPLPMTMLTKMPYAAAAPKAGVKVLLPSGPPETSLGAVLG